MKKLILVLLLVSIIGLIFWSCSEDSSTEPENIAPICEIISPSSNTGFNSGDTIQVLVSAEDIDGTIKEVRYYIDGISVYSVQTFPFHGYLPTADLSIGGHIIKVVAEDNNASEIELELGFWIKPQAPTNLQVVQNNVYTFTVTWEDTNNQEDGFIIERKIDDGAITEIKTTAETIFIDSTISKKGYSSVYYQVRAFKEIYNSDYVGNSYSILFPAPSNLTYTKENLTVIKLDWQDRSNGEDGFKIDKKVGVSDWIIDFASLDENVETWTDSNAEINEILQYRIYAYKGLNMSGTVLSTIDNTFPAPTNLKATHQSITEALLIWDDNSIGEDRFDIERKLSTESNYVKIAEVTGSDTVTKIWSDTTVVPDLTYGYRIKAVYSSYPSDYSTVSYENKIPAPSNISFKALSTASLKLDWTDNSNGEDGFIIDRKVGKTGSWVENHVTVGVNIVTWTDTDYNDYEAHYYRVRAYYSTYYSDYTAEVHTIPVVFVQGGAFEMGDRFNEGNTDELPVHSVTVSDFYIGKYEVTQSEWAAYMPVDTYYYGAGDNYPVYYVSWYDIIKYCNLRSISEGITPCYTISDSTDPANWGTVPISSDPIWNAVACNWSANGYRLPTEAEWEYAARGGLSGQRFPNGATISHSTNGDTQANFYSFWYGGSPSDYYDVSPTEGYNLDYNGKLSSVGSFPPNGYGLYDMSGNLCEWCWDWHGLYTSDVQTDPTGPSAGSRRILRGGNNCDSATFCRVASRLNGNPYDRDQLIVGRHFGFRVVRIP